jgi:GNAT superfamily N-acetyltransferase
VIRVGKKESAAKGPLDAMQARNEDRGPFDVQVVLAETEGEMETTRMLFLEYAGTLPIDLSYQGFHDEVSQLPGEYARPRGCLLLARVGNDVAGCVAVRPLTMEACEMKRLYVKPMFRGKGVGKVLVERSIAEARGCGYRRMMLDTLPEMIPAITLYKSLGFLPCEPYYTTPIKETVFLSLAL